jgi:uncharacterized protein (TIGR02246 family)
MRRLSLVILLFAAVPAVGGASDAGIRKVLDDYVKAWLAGDSDKVMRQLTRDCVFIPTEKTPYVGADAIRNYWFPPKSPPFKLDRFSTTVDQIVTDHKMAIVRGTQIIEWTSGKDRWRTRGNYVTALRYTSAGWKISMQVAANAPNERIP